MEKENMTANAERRLHPVALFCLRVAASAMPIAGNGWVLFESSQFRVAMTMRYPLVIAGIDPTPMIVQLVEDYRNWLVVVCSAAVLAAIVYVWGFARRAGSIIGATLGAAALCVIAGGTLQIATIEAWRFDAELRNSILDSRATSRP